MQYGLFLLPEKCRLLGCDTLCLFILAYLATCNKAMELLMLAVKSHLVDAFLLVQAQLEL